MVVPFPMNMTFRVCYFPGRDLSTSPGQSFCYPQMRLLMIAFQSFSVG